MTVITGTAILEKHWSDPSLRNHDQKKIMLERRLQYLKSQNSRPSSSRSITEKEDVEMNLAKLHKSSEPTQVNDGDCVLIYVFDESRNQTRTFVSTKTMLLREMKYFVPMMSNAVMIYNEQFGKKVYEIDVHSDILVFEWLMDYCDKQTITLQADTVISVLISSSFLQMDKLEAICIEYIKDNLANVIQGI
jgi:hypothetical protein